MTKPELKHIPLIDIAISKTNPRKHFDDESINELAQSIFQKGVLQPVVVRQNGKPVKYELVCGERRYRASLKAQALNKDITSIPAVIRELTNDEALELQIIENLQRKDVHPMEEAVAFKGLIDLKKFDVHEIARRIGKGASYVTQRLKLNDLIPEFQKAFYSERMNLTDSLNICRLTADDQKDLWEEEGFDNESNEIELDRWMLQKYTHNLNDAPFDTTNPELKKDMGACTSCPFNSASNTLLFPDLTGKAICTNSHCFQQKCDTSYTNELKAAMEDPAIVLVSDYYQMEKDAKALQAKGNTVYSRGTYSEISKPDEINYDEDCKGNNDTEEEDRKEFEEATADYKKELADYEKKVASGKFLRAFVVEGNDKGKYMFITLSKSATSAATTKATKVKQEDGTLTSEDIQAEIQRIKDAEKRKKELDEEKIHMAAFEIFKNNKEFDKSEEVFTTEELRAAIIFIAEENFECKRALEKHLKHYNDYSSAGLFKKLPAIKHNDLWKLFYKMVRVGILNALAPSKGAPNQRPDASGRAGALAPVMKHYEPIKIKEIESTQYDERLKREGKVESRLEKLREQLKGMKTEAKKVTPKKSKASK